MSLLYGIFVYIYIYRQHTGLWNPSKNTIPQELEKNEVQLQQAPDLNIHMFIYMVFIQICFHNFLQAVVYILENSQLPGLPR